MPREKKSKKIFKMFRTEIKAVDDKEGIIDMLIPMSTDSVDRANESIDPMGWKKSLPAFRKRAILVSSHSYNDLRKQIGELVEIEAVKEGLLAKPKYYINQGNEEADWGFKLASKGMAAFSVGFIPIKWEDSDGKGGKPLRTFTEQELLEISHVVVPCNRDAIQEMQGKSEDPIINKTISDILEAGFIEIEEKAKYNCECIKCDYKMTSDKHCKEIKCPKCGGTMRRVERPGPGEADKLADSDESNKIADDIRKKVLDVPVIIEPIDEDKVKASIDKDKKELEMNALLIDRILEIKIENEKLKEKIKEVELKAGAVLNAKNKSNLKKAQDLIQSVLDSAGITEEDPEKVVDDNKDDKGDDDVIDIVTDTVDDIVINEEEDEAIKEAKFTAKIEEIINQSMTDNRRYYKDELDYAMGRVKK